MSKKAMLVIIAVLSAALAIMILLMILRDQNHKTGHGTAKPIYEEKSDTFFKDNVLELSDYLGKAADETDIPSACFKEQYGSDMVIFTGHLFGKDADGYIRFSKDDVKGILTGETVHIYSQGASFDECRTEMEKLYGKAVFEGEEPYASANGGAVTHSEFKHGKCRIILSSAEERKYVEVTIEKMI